MITKQVRYYFRRLVDTRWRMKKEKCNVFLHEAHHPQQECRRRLYTKIENEPVINTIENNP